ncbi:hypothetical protein WOLCODRAFT_67554, partial [Wolfiporia cocos MD-104 SS10]
LPEIDWTLVQMPSKCKSCAQLEDKVDELTENLKHAQQHIMACNLIIKSSHAQLVIQNLALQKQSDALYAKETTKDDDRTCLFPEGKGWVLTGDDFTLKMKKAKDAKAEK